MNIQEIMEVIQSSHLNFLVGAGASAPFLPPLGDIETRLTNEANRTKRIKIKKEYFEKIIIPNLHIIRDSLGVAQPNFNQTMAGYKNFFELVNLVLLKRKSTLLSKQVNIFTTNIDILMEIALEKSNLEYNDGFSGRLNSVFSLSNFKKSTYKRSLHFEHKAEIPIFNLIKMHGSLLWVKEGEEILFSKLNHFDESLISKGNKTFDREYNKLAIVNPEKEKFEKTVVDLTHYELLRMYSSELEKENSVLFVVGFSMEDEHIREITIRSANSNPTLKIYVFCHSKTSGPKMRERLKLGELKYSNVEILEPEDDSDANKYKIDKVTKTVFKEILDKMNHDNKE